MAKTAIGLEITEESVRVAEVSLGKSPQLVSWGEVPLPPDAAKDSEVLDSGAVAVGLRQLWTGAHLKGREVVLGLASRRIIVREYTAQAMRPDLMRDALPFQVQDLLPVPATQAVLDFYPLAQNGDQINGLLVAAVSETVEQLVDTLARVKVRPAAVDLTAFGIARAVARTAAPDSVTATVYIGDHTTQFVVTHGGTPTFVRILPVDVATQAASRGETTQPADPVAEPVGQGIGGIRSRGAMRASSADSSISDLTARIRSTLSFYGSRYPQAPVSEVLVTGAGAGVDGVMRAMSVAIDVPLRMVTVADIIPARVAPAGESALNLVSTAGLALGGGK